MKYSELKNYLDKIDNLQNELKTFQLSITNFFSNYNDVFLNIKNLSAEIDRLKQQLYINDYFNEVETYLSKYSDLEIEKLGPRLLVNSNFLFPGLYIGNEPKLANFLVASDPLYIATWNRKVQHSMLKQFNEKYQKKIRVYGLRPGSMEDFNDFPAQQFANIVCWDIITFMSKKNISIFIDVLNKLLRPGGTLIFNFHNCDKPKQLADAENTVRPFQTLQDITDICKIFETCQYYNFSELIDYVVVKKAGKLDTIKIQPVLGEILLKST